MQTKALLLLAALAPLGSFACGVEGAPIPPPSADGTDTSSPSDGTSSTGDGDNASTGDGNGASKGDGNGKGSTDPSTGTGPAAPPPAQLVTVISPDWDVVDATLQR